MKSRMSPLVTSAACNLQKKTKMCDMVRKKLSEGNRIPVHFSLKPVELTKKRVVCVVWGPQLPGKVQTTRSKTEPLRRKMKKCWKCEVEVHEDAETKKDCCLRSAVRLVQEVSCSLELRT